MTAGDKRPALLFLAHRIPYPPNKGDKIRSYHLLKALSARYRVHLGCFIDDPEDAVWLPNLEALTESVCAIPIRPAVRKLASLAAITSRGSMSARFYANKVLADYVAERLPDVERVLVFSSPMMQFLPADIGSSKTCLADYVDVDSLKWRQYAARKPFPVSWLYRLESRRLARDERIWAARARRVSFVSEDEAELFQNAGAPQGVEVLAIPNGVDATSFDPRIEHPDPKPSSGPRVVFVGAMDYWANVDAVKWFVETCWPRILAKVPEAQFQIVGRHPTNEVQRLAGPKVLVTGGVEDVRAWVAHADVVVAPLRIARGIQNKVLEAMAMARPIVATPEALEGIRLPEDLNKSMRAKDPDAFAAKVCEVLGTGAPEDCPDYRQFVLDHYSWQAAARSLEQVFAD